MTRCTQPHLLDGIERPCTAEAVVVIGYGDDPTQTMALCAEGYTQFERDFGDRDLSSLTIVECP